MRVLMVSKACVVGMYQRKLEELAAFADVELSVVVPPYWRDRDRVVHLEKAYTTGYTLHVLPIVFNGHFHIHFYRGLNGLFRQLRPHILHIDEEAYNLAAFQAMRLATRHGAQALFFTWQNLLRRYPYPFSFFEHYNFEHAASAIAGNQEAQGVLRRKGYKGLIHVLPQFGVDPELYRRQPVPSEGQFVIGYVGRMVEEKGVHLLLQAAAALEGEWALRLIGDGPHLSALRALSTELGIEQRVRFESWKPSAEMPYHLSSLDVLILPSLTRRNWKEQFGRVLVEAMACEVPVVGSSSGEIPFVIGDAGLVFPEGDAVALRDTLARLMQDPTLHADLSRRGRARVLEHYTQQRIAASTRAIYRKVLGAV